MTHRSYHWKLSAIHYPHSPGTSWEPADAFRAYGGNIVFPQAKRPGIVGIVELGGAEDPNDTREAFAKWGLPHPIVSNKPVLGGRPQSSDADGEVALDIQLAAAWCSLVTGLPTTVNVYYAPNSDDGFGQAQSQAADDGCDTYSCSWGSPESQWGRTSIQAYTAKSLYAYNKGLAMWAASGDNDSGDGLAGVHVDFPASCPYYVGCGGTRKTATAEAVWNNGANEGTGGGFSDPSIGFPVQPWQIGAPAGPGRMVPDVAGIADPQTGWNIVLNGRWGAIGGTSAVAPMYAGLFAGFAALLGKLPKDLVKMLWSRPACFADIIDGTNGQWRAKAGPDPCTGLGVPRIDALWTMLSGGGTPDPGPEPIPTPVERLLFTKTFTKAVPADRDYSTGGKHPAVPVGAVQKVFVPAGAASNYVTTELDCQ